MITLLLHRLRLVPFLCGGHRQLALENLALHQQLAVYKRSVTRPKLRTTDRFFWVGLARVWAGWRHSLLPILQHVALSNKHINHPGMGPYILADAEPVDAGGVEATKKAFFAAVDRGLYNAADHHFLWLWGNIPHAEALDLLLTVAIPKNTLDDHYFIFPMFTWRALDWLGREHTSFLMRPAVRYVTRFPTPPVLKDIEPLLEEYELLKRPLGFHTSPDEAPASSHLAEPI